MSIDPQDLLYTNQFISENVINKDDLRNETKNYNRYQRFIKSKSNLTKKYIRDDLYSDDSLNTQNKKLHGHHMKIRIDFLYLTAPLTI